jgi:integrase
MSSRGSIYRRCGCREVASGRQFGPRCPKLDDPDHGTWYLAVDVPGFADSCARHRVRRGGYPTREAAKQSLAELRRPDLRAGVDPSISTGAWLRTWLASRISLAPISAHGYATHVRLYLEPFLGRIPLSELRTAQIQEMFTQLARHGAAGIPLSPNTLARVRATLRAALNAAIRDGLIHDNPARNLELPAPRRPRAVIWTEERIAEWQATGIHPTIAVWTASQTAQFLHASRTHRLYAAFHLIALRGLRRAETSGLRWSDIDLQRGILLITHTTQRVGGQLMQCPPKSTSSRRTVILDHTTVTELRRHYARQQAEAARLHIDPSGYVFTNRRGQPLNPDHLYREFIRAAATPGSPRSACTT